jgi:hypothetical protein
MWCDVTWRDVTWRDVMWCDVTWRDVTWCDVMWCDVMWCDVMWRDVTWRDVAWRGVAWRGVACRGVAWHDVTWRDVTWCDVMWCDVMWCDVMWCDVMWCDVMCLVVTETVCPQSQAASWAAFSGPSWQDVTCYLWNIPTFIFGEVTAFCILTPCPLADKTTFRRNMSSLLSGYVFHVTWREVPSPETMWSVLKLSRRHILEDSNPDKLSPWELQISLIYVSHL